MEFPLISRAAKYFGKPIVIVDTETTGLLNDPKTKIVELAYLSILPTGETKLGEKLINPERSIPINASNVHGIYDHDVVNKPSFPAITPIIDKICNEAIFCGYNSKSFDFPLIQKCYKDYGLSSPEKNTHIDVRNIWCKKQKTRKGELAEVAQHFGVEVENEHRAGGDVTTTANVLEEMIFHWGMELILSEANNNPSPTKKNLRESKKITSKTLAIDEILNFLKTNNKVLPCHFGSIAKKAGVPKSTISFAIKDLLDTKQISEEQIVQEDIQEKLELYLENAIEKVGLEKLRPLKEHLDKICNTTIEYNQLRIALENRQYQNEQSPCP